MNVKILGPSCANCLKLELLVMQVLTDMGVRDATVEKVAAERQMEHYLTGEPPGLVINELLVWSGRKELPSRAQVRAWISEVTATA